MLPCLELEFWTILLHPRSKPSHLTSGQPWPASRSIAFVLIIYFQEIGNQLVRSQRCCFNFRWTLWCWSQRTVRHVSAWRLRSTCRMRSPHPLWFPVWAVRQRRKHLHRMSGGRAHDTVLWTAHAQLSTWRLPLVSCAQTKTPIHSDAFVSTKYCICPFVTSFHIRFCLYNDCVLKF